MPLGTQVGLGPGHIVLDGEPAPSRKAARFIYAVSAILLLPVWGYASRVFFIAVLCNLLHPDIASVDCYGFI